MPLPWKRSKSKSSRISKFVSDLQQSPKHGGSLVVETGFPTSLIDLFVKNRDRLQKTSSKRSIKAQTQCVPNPPRRRVSSPPPPLPLQRRRSFPQKLDPALVTEDTSVNKIEERFVDEDDGVKSGNHGGGGCVLMVVMVKVFVVAVLALSTKKLTVGITLSAFALLFLELAVTRVFTFLNLCPDVRIDSLVGKLVGKRRQAKLKDSSSTHDVRDNVSFEIMEESNEEIRIQQPEKKSNWEDSSTLEIVAEKKEVQTIRDVVFKNEKSKSSKLRSKIVKKIVPKKLRKKKKKMKIKETEEAVKVEVVEEEEEESVTEVSSLFSDERIESDAGSNPPMVESGEDIEGEEESGSKGDLSKPIVLIVIVLAGLLSGKVLAIGLTLFWCLSLRVFCCKSQT